MRKKMVKTLLQVGLILKPEDVDDPGLLNTAVEKGNLKIVEDLLKDGADVNMLNTTKFGRSLTPLHSAVNGKQVEMAELLINYGANVNVKDGDGITAIDYAIKYQDSEMTELLLTNGANIKQYPNLLCTAVENRSLKIVEALLTYGADVNMLDSPIFARSRTSLHSAVNGKQVEMAKLLINYGANVNVKDGDGITPIDYAIKYQDSEMIELLLTNGANVKEYANLLCTAVAYGCLKLVEDLLNDGADVNMLNTTKFGRSLTPLHSAVNGKQVKMAELLINYGANVNVKDDDGITPIDYAIKYRDSEMIELLLINGADIKDDDPNLLFIAVEYGCLKLVEVLLTYGADVNMLGSSIFGRNRTPLHIAVNEKQVEMAKLLINYGANVNVEDDEGRTPIDYAIKSRPAEMFKLLLTNGADLKVDLCVAVEYGCLKLVEDLLKGGADVNMLYRSKFGRRLMPLHSAVDGKQVEMAKLLINYGANVNVEDDHFISRMRKSPIVYAIENADTEMTELLLTNGANIKKYPDLLCTAVENRSLKIVEGLLTYGADVNMLGSSIFGRNRTPLHSAVNGKQVEMAELLINYGANVNVKDYEGRTPIVYAIENRDTEMTELLLTNGVHIKDDPNLLCSAVEYGCLKLVQDLLEDGADVNKLYMLEDGSTVTPLHSAVNGKQVEMAKLLINYGANVNVKDGFGSTPLHCAIEYGDGYSEIIKLLISKGADLKEDANLLCIAAEYGCLKLVENLLKDGANVNTFNNVPTWGRRLTPLHSAVNGKQVEMAELLINYGANVNVKDGFGSTPIDYAIKNRDTEMAKILINYGANVNVKDSKRKSPIAYAIKKGDTEMTELLLTNGATVKEYPNLLCGAVKYRCLKLVEDLLKDGADVNKLNRSKFGKSLAPLHIAVSEEQVEMAELLINYGANVNVKDGEGRTAIVYAIKNSDTDMIKLLLTKGVHIKDNPNLLNTAVEYGSLEIVEGLLWCDVDINASDLCGRTALHSTVLSHLVNDRLGSSYDHNFLYDKEEIAELLLRKGANVNVATKSGVTTICAASRKGNKGIVQMLLKYGAECDPIADDVIKPLHAAAVGGHSEIIESLLKFGAEIDSRDMYGRTALHFASRGGHEETVQTLLEYGSDVNIISKYNHTPLEYGMLVDVDNNSINDDYHYNLDNDNDLPHTIGSRTTELLKQHIAKMKAAALHVSERNLQFINNHSNIFLGKCEAEIEIMKGEKIDNSCACFYDILTKNTSTLAKNEIIVQALKSDDYEIMFPIYASMIYSRFRRGVERKELLEQVRNTFLHSLFESLPELPLFCTEKIFNYLSDKDLRKLLVACEIFNK